MTVKRPALRYFGGKWKIAPKIIKWFPPHKIYVELFGGAASVLLRKERSKVEVYNDIDSEAVNFFQIMRDCAGDLLFRLYYTPYSREEYYRCLDYDGDDPVEQARAFFVRSWQGYIPVSTLSDAIGWRRSITINPNPLLAHHLVDVADRLNDVYIENQDFRVVIDSYDTSQTLFYADPTYFKARRRYTHWMSRQDHIDLAHVLAGIEGYAILSATDSGLYRDLYVDWIWEPLKVLGMHKHKKTEYLIMNYEFIGCGDG